VRPGAGSEIRVEALLDGLVAQALRDPPGEDLVHDRASDGVGNESGLGLAIRPAGGHGVRDLLSPVAVGRDADVPALAGVLAQAVPGLLQDLQHVPFGDALLDPTGEDGRRPFAIEGDGFIGGEEADAAGLQVVLDLGAVVGAPRDALDRLADHRVEPSVGTGRLGEQVVDATLTGDRDRQALVRRAGAARPSDRWGLAVL